MMKPTSLFVILLVVGALACGGATEPPAEEMESAAVGEPAGEGSILRLDPRLDSLVPPGATIEKVAEGYTFTEGPVWIRGRAAAPLLRRASQRHPPVDGGRRRQSVHRPRPSRAIPRGSGPSRPTA